MIDITDSSDKATEIDTNKEIKVSLEEAKLATERVTKEQAAGVEADSKVIGKLEGYFLDAIGGSSREVESLPFENFLYYLYHTEPEDLRKYNVGNSIRVDRLRKLHKFAYQLHSTGQKE